MPPSIMLADYQENLQQLLPAIAHAQASQALSLRILVAALVLFPVLLLIATKLQIPAWTAALPVPVAIHAGWSYATLRRRALRLCRLRGFYEGGCARIEDRWQGSGSTGEDFRVPNHVYDSDLQPHDANLHADATGGLVQFSGPLAKVPGDGQVDRQEESYPWP